MLQETIRLQEQVVEPGDAFRAASVIDADFTVVSGRPGAEAPKATVFTKDNDPLYMPQWLIDRPGLTAALLGIGVFLAYLVLSVGYRSAL